MTKEEWEKLPPYMQSTLRRNGIFINDMKNVPEKGQPYTNVGVVNSPEHSTELSKGIEGVTFLSPNTVKQSSNSFDRDRSSLRLYNQNQINKDPRQAFITRAHETEHALADQGGANINKMWNEMTEEIPKSSRGVIVGRLIKHAPHLVKNWGLSDTDAKKGYFSEKVLFEPDSPNYLKEQLATLSALEQSKQKRFVDDPYVRKHILTTPEEREAYEALTGLRQTRLDAKDLPPYTRQKGSTDTKDNLDNSGFMAKIKSMLGMYQGGLVKPK